jgi:large subunit ribosomal protein L30
VEDTLRMLHLNRANHATLIPATPTFLGMLQKVKDHVTWGEISLEHLTDLLAKRGLLEGGKKLTERHPPDGLKEVAAALHSGKLKLKDLEGVKPIFRLTPPSGGFKHSLKYSCVEGGETGYRGEKINELIKKMV